MKTWTLTTLGLASAIAVGCAGRDAAEPKPAAPVGPKVAECHTPHEKARECRDVTSGRQTRTVCDIDVLHQGNGKTNLYPHSQNIPNGTVTIVWEIRGQGKEFQSGDGPLELKSHAACSGGSPSNDKDGASTSTRGKYYRIDCDGNKVGTGIYYTIQFTDKNDKTQSCDPNIVNENG